MFGQFYTHRSVNCVGALAIVQQQSFSSINHVTVIDQNWRRLKQWADTKFLSIHNMIQHFRIAWKKNIKIQQIKMACQIVPETMANDTLPKVRPIKIASKYN